VKLENILFFDDSLENIVEAKKNGLQTVHVTFLKDIEVDLKEILA
jgi:FMN phosphatase YigB (HAD superfamily)